MASPDLLVLYRMLLIFWSYLQSFLIQRSRSSWDVRKVRYYLCIVFSFRNNRQTSQRNQMCMRDWLTCFVDTKLWPAASIRALRCPQNEDGLFTISGGEQTGCQRMSVHAPIWTCGIDVSVYKCARCLSSSRLKIGLWNNRLVQKYQIVSCIK